MIFASGVDAKRLVVRQVDSRVLEQAIVLGLTDFEDAVQVGSAIKLGLEAIVTRDVNGFTGSPIPVLSPKDMRNRLM